MPLRYPPPRHHSASDSLQSQPGRFHRLQEGDGSTRTDENHAVWLQDDPGVALVYQEADVETVFDALSEIVWVDDELEKVDSTAIGIRFLEDLRYLTLLVRSLA